MQVQHAATEVWASVLRRLKTSARKIAVILLAKNLIGVEDASAWMLIFACKVHLAFAFSMIHFLWSQFCSQSCNCCIDISNRFIKVSQLSQLASTLELGFPMHHLSMESSLLTFAGSVLLAGDRDKTLATTPGRVFILCVFETTPEFGISLLGLLIQLGWSGWMSIAQPSLLRMMSKLLVHAPKRTLQFLARLVCMGVWILKQQWGANNGRRCKAYLGM